MRVSCTLRIFRVDFNSLAACDNHPLKRSLFACRGNKLLGMLYSVEDHARMVAQLSESKRAMSQLVVERKQSLEKCEQLLRSLSLPQKQDVHKTTASHA